MGGDDSDFCGAIERLGRDRGDRFLDCEASNLVALVRAGFPSVVSDAVVPSLSGFPYDHKQISE